MALESEDASALCPAPSCSLADFWDRARAVGVSAAVLRETPIGVLADRGEALYITRQEFEKWKALGLVAPGAVLKPDTLWIKDPGVLTQVLDAVGRRGVAVSTSATAGYQLVQFPEGYASVEDSLGVYDSEAMAALQGRRLAVVYAGAGAAEAPGDPSGTLIGLTWGADGQVTGQAGSPGQFPLRARSVAVDAPEAELMRAAWSYPQRLLVVRLEPALGREANFDLLRERLRALARRGPQAPLPAQAPPGAPAPGPVPAAALACALWLIAALGGLLSARVGLAALKRSRGFAQRRLPPASPVLELLIGAAAALAAAHLFGCAARACLDALGRPVAPQSWTRLATACPIFVGVLTLYAIDPHDLARRVRRPVTWRQVFWAAGLVAAAALILEPRRLIEAAGAAPLLARLEDASPSLWWGAWRWREALVGFPCLLYSMSLIEWRLECPDCSSLPKGPFGDPRTWFLPGLLAPAGVLEAAARGGPPLTMAFWHSCAAGALGCALGAALIGWGQRRGHEGAHPSVASKGPIAA